MDRHIAWLLALRDADDAVPFVQRLRTEGRIVGCTRLMELRRWRGRPEPDEVEIGGTWLAGDVQRTAVNTESKLLLLTYAFETWNVDRVALATDERNERSRAAILRLGATFEGILRNHRPSRVPGEDGRSRNTALFSITAAEWPAVRRILTERLDQGG
jgi:RimJ/RimL family protein N-acetyltransferase